MLPLLLLLVGFSFADLAPASDVERAEAVTTVDFWNGNRSQARQVYEREVLEAVLTATEDDFGAWEITESLDDYPGDEESRVFAEKGHDLFVTIAGNQKFGPDDMLVVAEPLTRNLLGYRIPIIRETDAGVFAAIEDESALKALRHGIPETWSDATIFRHNGYTVVEEGDFDDVFDRLRAGRFDYSAFGVNEVLGVFERRASERPGLTIDRQLLLFYPFPLVFYVNPQSPELADRIEQGMRAIITSGRLDAIFDRHYGDIVARLGLDQRTVLVLDNPLVPERYKNLKPDLNAL
ncbi:MAG: hypothetical protein RQ729_12940 [Wenzhouxiangellaceae bacterium]|nr:hypothetical protein [Wenzhouxiangellaceae bacterium]